MTRVALLMAALAVAHPIHASAAPSPAGCSAAEYRQLDFWLGDWDAYDAGDAGTAIARTHVDLIAAGCAVHELYEQTDGLIGDSILSFDAARQLWQQTWVTNRGSLMVIAGRFNNSAVTLEGEMHTGDGRTLLQRITWKVEGSDVRETAVVSKDSGKSWVPAFDVLFRRHSAA
jgi:hypothetical protein